MKYLSATRSDLKKNGENGSRMSIVSLSDYMNDLLNKQYFYFFDALL